MATTEFDKSIFKQFFDSNDSEVILYRDNLLSKLVNLGIVPKYVIRGENNNENGEDDDYISFWTNVSEFLAYYVIYARKIYGFKNHRELLIDYLINKNVGLSPTDILSNFQLLMNRLYDQHRLRGTAFVFRYLPTEDVRVFTGVFPPSIDIDGEFIRAISKLETDDFAVIMTEPKKIGWCICQSSPLYRGTLFDYQLIKCYESTDYAFDKTKYPQINEADVTIVPDISISADVLKFKEGAGFGLNPIPINQSGLVVINKLLNYEITFNVKSFNLARFTFGVHFYDSSFTLVSSVHIDGTTDNSVFVNDTQIWQDDKYYSVRGIIFGTNEPNRASQDSLLDYGVGKHIKIPDGATYALPSLIMSSGADSTSYLLVHNFKMRISDTIYSRCFIQTPNIIQVWAKNNNGMYSSEEVDLISALNPTTYNKVVTIPTLENFVSRYLIPYNCTPIFNWLGSNSVNGYLQTEDGIDIFTEDSSPIIVD